MPLSRWLTLQILMALFLDPCVAQTKPTPGVVESVELTSDVRINDQSLERLLRITTVSGTFQLSDAPNNSAKGRRSVRLRLDFYRDAERISIEAVKPGVGGSEDLRHGQFSVQIVDTDYLKLGDAPPGHWQIFTALMLTKDPNGRGVLSAGPPVDVPKTQFNARARTRRIGRFTEFPDKSVREIPIFFSASGRVQECASLSELLRENPESDILVGVIELQ